MSPRSWIPVLVGGAALGAVIIYLVVAAGGTPQQPVTSIGRDLYAANCAKCHGANLEGQPDWMKRNENGRLPAPPHDESGHTWHHSDKQLFTITKFGLAAIAPGYKSDMPAFENVLTDVEITAVWDYIKGTWSDRARAFQQARTDADPD
jgi:mono/diheme cytochrome c family protein